MDKPTNEIDSLARSSRRVVYMLCDGCPTCHERDRQNLEAARKMCATISRTEGHTVAFMVVLPGNTRWRPLKAIFDADHPNGGDLPAFFHFGRWARDIYGLNHLIQPSLRRNDEKKKAETNQ